MATTQSARSISALAAAIISGTIGSPNMTASNFTGWPQSSQGSGAKSGTKSLRSVRLEQPMQRKRDRFPWISMSASPIPAFRSKPSMFWVITDVMWPPLTSSARA